MSRKLIEVRHPGFDETAKVPESALRHMKGWVPVETTEQSDDKDYSSWKVDRLKGEIDQRNADREVPIEVEEPGNKPELVAALEADDQNQES